MAEVQILKGGKVIVDVNFRNAGLAAIADTQWRVGVKKQSGAEVAESVWQKTGPIAKDETVLIHVESVHEDGSSSMPGDWGDGEKIDVNLDCEILDSSGNVLDSSKPMKFPNGSDCRWIDFFVIVVPSTDWIQIVSATPKAG